MMDYFQDYTKYFWRWEDDGEVIVIDRMTVIYQKQLQELLISISEIGLPKFGSLLLVIAATNIRSIEQYDNICEALDRCHTGNFEDNIKQAKEFIEKIYLIDQKHKRGIRKIHLLLAVFENSHNRKSIKSSQTIASVFRKTGLSKEHTIKFSIDNKTLLDRELRILQLLNKKFPTTDSIEQKILELPEIEDIDLEIQEDTESKQGLLEQLISNDVTFKVGILIERIWSSANIPMQQKIPSGQPFGGVADITNKGTYDKLLPSEFANEEISFISRIANNEAMFFHREAPPSSSKKKRVILQDVSIKNWGSKKTILFSIMLAISKHPKNTKECVSFSIGESEKKNELQNINNIIDAYNHVEVSIDCVDGLEKFFLNNINAESEIFFLTRNQTYNNARIQFLMEKYNYPIDYWIHTSSDGKIDIFKKFRSGRKHHQSILLPVKELWKKKKEKVKSKLDLPKDLLLPSPANYKYILYEHNCPFKITGDGFLMRGFVDSNLRIRNDKGWEVLHNNIPVIHAKHCIGRSLVDDSLYLISYNVKTQDITILNVNSKKTSSIKSPLVKNTRNCEVLYYSGVFYFLGEEQVFTLDLSGKWVNSDTNGKLSHLRIYNKENKKKLISIVKTLHFTDTIFKNFDFVCIDLQDQLIINKFRLILNHKKNLVLKTYNAVVKTKCQAVKESTNKFTFGDGSELLIQKGGLISLISSNPDILPIRIISRINEPLAVIVNGTFAGNKKYYKESFFLIKKSDHNSYIEIRDLNRLNEKHNSVEVYQEVKEKSMEYIFENYIKRFIKHIRDYAN